MGLEELSDIEQLVIIEQEELAMVFVVFLGQD
jgi:hypothetical protein